MKKLITIAFIISAFTASSAFAKTEGHYLGISAIKTNLESGKYQFNGINYGDVAKVDDSSTSFGMSYKYAFNFEAVYIAPTIFYDHSNISSKGALENTWDLNSRYGLGADIGYDFTDQISAYLKTGIANNRYEFVGGSSSVSDGDISAYYGIGAKYSILENLDINLEYEVSEFEADIGINGNDEKHSFDINVMRIGVSYKF